MSNKKLQKPIDFWATILYTDYGLQKGAVLMSPRTGRPTENKKGKPIHVRLDEKSDEILEKYVEQEKVSRAEAIRRGILKLESDIKEK